MVEKDEKNAVKNKRKTVKVDFSNACGRMKLTLKSNNAVDLSMKIAKTFDEACKGFPEEEDKE